LITPDRVLDLGTNAGLRAVLAALQLIDNAAMAVTLVGEVLGIRRMRADHCGLPAIGLIPINPRLIAVQQLAQHGRVMHIRRRCRHRVDQLGLAVHAEVQLHSEIPLLTLAGLRIWGLAP
jgi:hypothetical protein